MYRRINETCSFAYIEDIEVMFAAVGILKGEKEPQYGELYTEEEIKCLQKKYPYLFELSQVFLGDYGLGMLEQIMYTNLEEFEINGYKESLLQLSTEDFICLYLERQEDKELIREGLKEDKGIEKFYFKYQEHCQSLLGVKMFFNETKRYINEFFTFVEDIKTDRIIQRIRETSESLDKEYQLISKDLQNIEPLEYSQQMMGKRFFHRGPYEQYIFMPSVYLPYRCTRFRGPDQILCYSLFKKRLNDETLLKQLKSISDANRLKIIRMLKEEEPVRGMDIAQNLSLAPSTVTHHMEQLRVVGLINEEQVKNSKYYTINTNAVNTLLDELSKILK